MKWIFAGTSHGIPEKNAFCSANFLVVRDRVYVVDAGGPVSPLLLNYDLKHENVRAVFISHEHGDHRDGLPEFLGQLTWYYGVKSTKVHPELFFPRREEIELMKHYLIATHAQVPDWMLFTRYREGVIFDDGVLRVTARKSDHTPCAHSFLFEAENKRVLYTGDMSYGFKEYERILNGEAYDLVVCESAHLAGDMVNDKLLKTNAKALRLTHLNPALKPGLAPVVENAPFDCAFAHDGMILTL